MCKLNSLQKIGNLTHENARRFAFRFLMNQPLPALYPLYQRQHSFRVPRKDKNEEGGIEREGEKSMQSLSLSLSPFSTPTGPSHPIETETKGEAFDRQRINHEKCPTEFSALPSPRRRVRRGQTPTPVSSPLCLLSWSETLDARRRRSSRGGAETIFRPGPRGGQPRPRVAALLGLLGAHDAS